MLQKQVITLDFGFGGLDQKTDDKRLLPTKLSEANNVRFRKAGRIERRYGTEQIATGTGMAKLLANDAKVITAGAYPSGYLFNDSALASITAGVVALPFGEVVSSRFPLVAAPRSTTDSSAAWTTAESDNYRCAVYVTGVSALAICMVSKTTGEQAYSYTLNNAVKPVLIADPRGNDSVVIDALDSCTTSATVSYYVVTPSTTPVLLAGLAAASVTTASNEYDLVTQENATYGAIIYAAVAQGASGVKLSRARWPNADGSGAALSSTVIAAATTVTRVALCEFVDKTTAGENLRVVWFDGSTGVRTAVYDSSLAVVQSNTVVTTFTTAPDHIVAATSTTTGQGTAFIACEYSNATTYLGRVQQYSVGGFGVVSFGSSPPLCLASRMVCVAGSDTVGPIWWSTYDAPAQKTNVLMGGTNRALGVSYRGLSFGRIPRQVCRPPAFSRVSGKYTTSALVRRIADDPLAESRLEFFIDSVDVSDAGTNGWGSAAIRNELLVAGSYLGYWSGDNVCPPVAPQLIPYLPSATGVYSASGALTAGSYQVSAIFEAYDRFGRYRRSAPVAPTSVVLSGTHNAITVTTQQYALSDGSSPAVALYRTAVGGSVFYRCCNQSATTAGLTTAVSLTIADATISTYEPLYITGGVLDSWQPPCPIAVASNGRRVLAVPGDNPNFVMQGKRIREQEDVAFFEEIGRYISTNGDRIYALASYLDKWFAFKKTCVFVASGDGADDTGQNDTLSEFEPISPGTGCSEPRSVLTTSAGVTFKSASGFYFVGSDLSPVYIGADVEDYNDQTVVDAAYDAADDECHFVMSGGDILVLSLFTTKQGIDMRWTVDEAVNAGTVAVAGGKRYIAGASLGVPGIYRDSTSFLDVNVSTTQRPAFDVTTAWVPLGQQQGFGRAYRATVLGTLPTTQTSLTVSVAVGWDYDGSAWSQTCTIIPSAMERNGDSVQFEIALSRQKGEAIRFRITQDVSSSNTTLQCMSLNQIQLVVGVKSNNNKIPATARAT